MKALAKALDWLEKAKKRRPKSKIDKRKTTIAHHKRQYQAHMKEAWRYHAMDSQGEKVTDMPHATPKEMRRYHMKRAAYHRSAIDRKKNAKQK